MTRLYLVADIGATWTRLALAREDGSIVERLSWRTPRSGSRVVEKLVEHASRLVSGRRVAAMGIGSIGPLDIREGRVLATPNGPREGFELGLPLCKRLGIPVYIANDCVAAVWGEHVYGVGRGFSTIVYLTLSSGVGLGAIVDGNLLIGPYGNAHEAGHIVVDYKRRARCGCGGWGHWEAYAGGANTPALARVLVEEIVSRSPGLAETEAYKLAVKGELDAPRLYELARRGDPVARKIVEEIIEANKAGVESVINMFEPELLIIGGSIALRNPDLVVKPLVEHIEQTRGIVAARRPRVALASFGDDEVLVGALALASHTPQTLLERARYLEDCPGREKE